MGRQMIQIEEIAREIEHVSSDLQGLYASLAEYARFYPQLAENADTFALYQKFVYLVEQSDSLTTKITMLKNLHDSILDGSNRVKEIEKDKKEISEKLNLLYSRIGAIAWEESYSNVLDQSILELIPKITQLHKEYSHLTTRHYNAKNKATSSLWFMKIPLSVQERIMKGQLDNLLKNNTKLFIEFGRIIAESSLIPSLISDSAPQIQEQYIEYLSLIKMKDDELVVVKEQMSSSKSQLEQEGMGVSIAKRIGELETALKESSKQRRLSAIMYGKTLTTIMSCEESKEYPSAVRECFDAIIEQQYIKTQLLRTTKKLNIEKKIEELVLLLRQDEDHVLHIEVQIGQLNHQIEEIHKAMAEKKEQIGSFQQQLLKVLPVESSDE